MKRSAGKCRTVSSNLGSDADSSHSRDGSQDLFSSHDSTGHILDDKIDLTLQVKQMLLNIISVFWICRTHTNLPMFSF